MTKNHFSHDTTHLRRRARRRWSVGTAAPLSTRRAQGTDIRAGLTLVLAAVGVANVIDSLRAPWNSFVTTLVLALFARACFVVAHHAADKRFAWLLSASVATGLAIAGFYNVINTTPKTWAAGSTIFIVMLFGLRCLTRQHLRRCARPPYEATCGFRLGSRAAAVQRDRGREQASMAGNTINPRSPR